MRCQLWRERCAGAAILAGVLLAGLRAQANAEEAVVTKFETKSLDQSADGPQDSDEDVLLFYNDDGEESEVADVLRTVDIADGDGSLHIEALPAGDILSVRAEPASPEGAKQTYWIGVQLRPVDDALRSHLKLAEGEGLMVGEVFPDSPGEKSGLKPHDILIVVGEKRIAEAANLLGAVEKSGGKELGLRVIRAGKEEQVTVTPTERPKRDLPNAPAAENEEVTRWLGELRLDRPEALLGEDLRRAREKYRYSIVRPNQAIVLSERSRPGVPEGTSITITREGNNPAKISVKRDAGTWDATEDKLGELPDDLRPMVERMLGRGQPGMPGGALRERINIQLANPPGAPGAPLPPPGIAPGAPPERVRVIAPPSPNRRSDSKIRELEDRLKKLEEELQKK